MRKFTAEEVAKIKEKYKYAERDFLKNLQAIHGKEEGLKQYNEIMECERHYHETEGSSGHDNSILS